MKRLGFLSLFALVSLPAMAQREWALFTADVGAGFSAPVYGAASRLDYGWNLNAGAGVRPIPYLGIKVDFGYNQFDFNRASAINLGFPRAQDRILSFTLDPIIH